MVKKTEPILERKAITITAVGPSVMLRVYISSIHPTAAPARSAAYSLFTLLGNLVNAMLTHMPLNTNGTDITAYIKTKGQSLKIDPCKTNGLKGIIRYIKKLRTMVIPNNKELKAR
ncbi:MAG: hypothetical protein A2042_06260 [Candidatus Schekmanbacteria bacterium GWA2_38_11]|uniref:Uncharacterized protein n=1 Tax=Candidatus Schekmanbacteria bacterium GWA2_38_11 TaxID=1817876 RepID=A0A1F7RLX6_9BACT|nr:MAG: hypothetical protein A2042_06260 [Candidatus Schekmanbacteria bacterium GWA2_38_11]